MIRDLAGAVALLTRLPVGPWAEGADPARCVWAYPLVGALLGALGAGVYAAGRALGLGGVLAALWALVALFAATGALHEDGLADAADGCLGGRSPEHRLAIMRDSRIGSFGALALLLSSAVRVGAIAALPPGLAVGALVAGGALGRAAMLLPILALPPARRDGLGATLAQVRGTTGAAGLALGAALAFAALPPAWATGALALAAFGGFAVAALARRLLGGTTGDVFGATSVLAECLVLTLLSTRPG